MLFIAENSWGIQARSHVAGPAVHLPTSTRQDTRETVVHRRRDDVHALRKTQDEQRTPNSSGIRTADAQNDAETACAETIEDVLLSSIQGKTTQMPTRQTIYISFIYY